MKSEVQGLGLFTTEAIGQDEIIGIKAGHIINRDTTCGYLFSVHCTVML